MPVDRKLKLICSQFSESTYPLLRKLAESDQTIIDIAALDKAIVESVSERLGFAEELLAAADRELKVAGGTYDIGARDAVSRAYYALHHVCRAVVLYEKRYDPYGHPAAISAFADIVKSVRFLETKLGSSAEVEAELTGFRLRRNDADYHIYGSATPDQTAVDFAARGKEVCERTKIYIDSAKNYVTLKEAGTI